MFPIFERLIFPQIMSSPPWEACHTSTCTCWPTLWRPWWERFWSYVLCLSNVQLIRDVLNRVSKLVSLNVCKFRETYSPATWLSVALYSPDLKITNCHYHIILIIEIKVIIKTKKVYLSISTSVSNSARRKWMYWLSNRGAPKAFLSLKLSHYHHICQNPPPHHDHHHHHHYQKLQTPFSPWLSEFDDTILKFFWTYLHVIIFVQEGAPKAFLPLIVKIEVIKVIVSCNHCCPRWGS